ncbi:MAG: helix-turn-helix transcriptional regulator [Treponemataceae bacterium]
MKAEITNRLKELRKHFKLNQTELAEKIGITQSSYSLIESGKISITEQNLKLVCFSFNVNEEWLRLGTGDMFDKEKQLSQIENDLLNEAKKTTPRGKKLILEYAKKIVEDQKALRAEIEQEKTKNNDTKKGAC